jgi:hypothetical protein
MERMSWKAVTYGPGRDAACGAECAADHSRHSGYCRKLVRRRRWVSHRAYPAAGVHKPGIDLRGFTGQVLLTHAPAQVPFAQGDLGDTCGGTR